MKQHWKVFGKISELFILVPALLGLKGNLDMCLASRLSTQANLGRMSSKSDIIHMVVGNIALVQVQATVASFIVSVFAIGVGNATHKSFVWSHAVLLISSSMFTATISCFVLGKRSIKIVIYQTSRIRWSNQLFSFDCCWKMVFLWNMVSNLCYLSVISCWIDFVLVAVILLSHRFHMNPDNLATPLAASIGDVVSLTVLSFIASTLYENLGMDECVSILDYDEFYKFNLLNAISFCRYTYLGGIHSYWHLFDSVACLGYSGHVQHAYLQGFEEWLDSRFVCSIH